MQNNNEHNNEHKLIVTVVLSKLTMKVIGAAPARLHWAATWRFGRGGSLYIYIYIYIERERDIYI